MNTNATTAVPGVGTQTTGSTPTVGIADSSIPLRIDEFIERRLKEAASADGYGLVSTAARARTLGFTSSANSRYADYLEAFRSTPELAARYAEEYPASRFLPWKAFHQVMRSLDLWCELPEFYAGAVPEEQIPWMEIFELRISDEVPVHEISELLPGMDRRQVRMIVDIFNDSPFAHQISMQVSERLRHYWRQALTSFFVIAPKEAFTSKEDWLSRFRKLATDATTRQTTAPDDPLVIRFCRGGVLVVSSWGDEAKELNAMTRELNL